MLRVLMDADCLIKITRAGYKEETVRAFKVSIPLPVVTEVVGQGSGRAESELISKNIEASRIEVLPAAGSPATALSHPLFETAASTAWEPTTAV